MAGSRRAGSEAGTVAGTDGRGERGGVRMMVVRSSVLRDGTGSSTAGAPHPNTATTDVNTVVVISVAVGMGTSYRVSLTYTPNLNPLASAQAGRARRSVDGVANGDQALRRLFLQRFGAFEGGDRAPPGFDTFYS